MVNIDQLLASGAMEGPYKAVKPATRLFFPFRYMSDLLHDVLLALDQFRYIRRHLRNGGNPDEAPF